MATRTRFIANLLSAKSAVQEVKRTVAVHKLDKNKLVNAQHQTDEYAARAAIAHEMAVVENLKAVNDKKIKARHPRIFKHLPSLTDQRDVLARQYGHGDFKIDWEKVWETIDRSYPGLERAIDDAIEESTGDDKV